MRPGSSDDEIVIFSWITYESRASRDEIMKKVMADKRIPSEIPVDGKRMIFGGFTPIVET